jgi:hypothetical protein
MQPRSACEEAGIVFLGTYECSTLLLAMELGPYEKETGIEKRNNEKHIFVFLGAYACSKLLLAMVLGPPKT